MSRGNEIPCGAMGTVMCLPTRETISDVLDEFETPQRILCNHHAVRSEVQALFPRQLPLDGVYSCDWGQR